MKIVDDSGSELPSGEVGEIIGRAPFLMSGYYKKPSQTTDALRNGWLYTGDLGYVDEDGYLFLAGRKKDLIISGGVNIYPKDLEEVIIRHPAVAEVTVFGIPHDRLGEEVAATVLPRAGAHLTVHGLQEHVRERLAPFKVPTRIAIVDEPLPRNPAGKILKRELRDELSRSGDSPLSSTVPGSPA